MKSQKPRKRVALAFPIGLAFIERLHHGILDYAREHGGWTFTRVPESLSPSIHWLRHWPGDGAIVLVTTPEDARIARNLKIPVVNLASHLTDASVPTVVVDHTATGRLAAEHLLGKRFQRFGFYGTRSKDYSQQRRQGFCETLKQAGYDCSVLETADLSHARSIWTDQEEELEKWLGGLQTPVGILASTDLRAGMVLNACVQLGLRVPEDVAVIGVDNDPVACEFSHPSLSSVSRNDRMVGYEAAALLDRLMQGGTAPREPVLIQPDGVCARRSTETLAIEDPYVAAAVQHVKDSLHENFGVERLAGQSKLSRHRMEHRFKAALGCTPYEFITRLRVDKARQLLSRPEKQTLSKIAVACGFSELRRFRLVFLRVTGVTPAAYRADAFRKTKNS